METGRVGVGVCALVWFVENDTSSPRTDPATKVQAPAPLRPSLFASQASHVELGDKGRLGWADLDPILDTTEWPQLNIKQTKDHRMWTDLGLCAVHLGRVCDILIGTGCGRRSPRCQGFRNPRAN